MLVARNESRSSPAHTFPHVKLRNFRCIQCKHQFFLAEFVPLRGLVPLLLECGHVVCESCAKSFPNKPCPKCNIISKDQGKTFLPLNMYALGLLVVSHNRTNHIDDADFTFSQPTKKSIEQQYGQVCHECDAYAMIRCPQCVALFCRTCYSKIHGRALQNHTKIMLYENRPENMFKLKSCCTDMCSESIAYFCNECDVSGCVHCMMRTHSEHDHILLIEKNRDTLPEFCEAAQSLSDCLQRIRHSQKKLKTISKSSADWESVETSITDHFIQLHGVLQNVEKKLIDSLYQERDCQNANLDNIAQQLDQHAELLQTAINFAYAMMETLEQVNMKDVIDKLQKLTDIPCHLVQDSEPSQQPITFHVDKTIIQSIEKHCSIQVPPVARFSLVRTELLPDDYEIEPLTQEVIFSSQMNMFTAVANRTRNLQALPSTSMLSIRSASSTSSLSSPAKSIVFTEGSSEVIRVTHVTDPSCFYIQQMSCKNKATGLCKTLTALAATTNDLPDEITPEKMYMVQSARDGLWYRGRITEKRTTCDMGDKHRVFFVDYGMDEDNVPLERMRNLGQKYAMLPVMAFKCALFEVVPNYGKWFADAIDAFKKLVTEDGTISMHILTSSGDTYYVDLCVISPTGGTLVSVTDSLIFQKHASRITTHRLTRMNPNAVRKYFKETLDFKKYINVEYLHSQSPDSIYVRKYPTGQAFCKKLTEEMTRDYTQNESHTEFIHVPEKDVPCAAPGSDSYWYRCVVCEEPVDDNVTVFYVDAGYTAQVPYNKIRTLPAKYMSSKAQAIKVSVRNVKPLPTDHGKWSLAANDFTRETLKKETNIQVVAFEKSNDTYSVSLCIGNNSTELATLLVQKGHAVSTRLSNGTGNRKWKNRKALAVCQKNSENTKELASYEPTSVKIETLANENEDPFKIRVLVHKVTSPDCIYVALVDSPQSFEKHRKQMQIFYHMHRSEKKAKWEEGAICVVYLDKDKSFYRAKILEIKSSEKAVVYLYDIGMEDTVAMRDIHSLHPDYTQFPASVFKVRLAGMLPCGGSETWTLSSCRELSEIINQNQTSSFYISKLEEKEGDVETVGIPVELWIKQRKIEGPIEPTKIEINSINRMLVEKGLALPIKDYAKKRDQILATEFKRQLEKRLEIFTRSEMSVQWHKINNEQDDDSTETNTDEITPTPSETENSDSSELLSSNASVPPKLAAWIPAARFTQDQFTAIPTNLDADGNLYLHSKAQHKKSKEIERKLEKVYKNAVMEPCDEEWAPGDMCIAQYHGNGKWYRGKVLEVLDGDTIQVQFIDYGNVEECAIGTLKKKVILGHLPIQCVKCVIADLKPATEDGHWQTSELDKIHSLLVEKECEVNVLDKNGADPIISITLLPNDICPQKYELISFLINEFGMDIINPYIEMVTPEEETISDADTADVVIEHQESSSTVCESIDESIDNEEFALCEVKEELITDEIRTDIPDLEENTCNKVENQIVPYVPQTALNERGSMNYKTLSIPSDVRLIEITICCCIDPITFLAQLEENAHSMVLNSYRKQYDLLMKDLQENASKQPMIKSLAPNTPCCAQFSDDVWYRCLITESECVQTSRDTKIKIKLLYVDFGNEEYKTVDPDEYELYSLKEEWFNVPIMSKKCKLWNIKVARPGDDLNAEMQDLYSKPALAKIIKIDDEVINVELYEDTKCKNVTYKWLIEDGFLQMK